MHYSATDTECAKNPCIKKAYSIIKNLAEEINVNYYTKRNWKKVKYKCRNKTISKYYSESNRLLRLIQTYIYTNEDRLTDAMPSQNSLALPTLGAAYLMACKAVRILTTISDGFELSTCTITQKNLACQYV